VLDGLDAKTGEPVSSCERLGGASLPALRRAIIRGFSVSETRVAACRSAPRDTSLAAITKGARLESIEIVEVCIFSGRPRSTPDVTGPTTFGGVVEREPTPAEAPAVGVVREEPSTRYATVEQDKLVSRIIVLYEGDDGPLGTAPPPAGVARVDPGPRPEPAPGVRLSLDDRSLNVSREEQLLRALPRERRAAFLLARWPELPAADRAAPALLPRLREGPAVLREARHEQILAGLRHDDIGHPSLERAVVRPLQSRGGPPESASLPFASVHEPHCPPPKSQPSMVHWNAPSARISRFVAST